MRLEDSAEWRRFTRHFKAHTLPRMTESALIVHLWPKQPTTELSFACQIGVSLLLDKPIVVVVVPGTKIPERLARVADHIIEWDGSEDGAGDLSDRIRELLP